MLSSYKSPRSLSHLLMSSCQYSFNVALRDKFAIEWKLKIPPNLKRVATLSCEICLQEIAMHENCVNCVNKLPRNTQTAMQEPLKIVVKNTRLMMWALWNSLTRRYFPSNLQNNCLHAAAAAETRLCSKILSHIINVQSQSLMMLVGKTKSVYTSLIIIYAKLKST